MLLILKINFELTKPKRYDIINTVVRERQQKPKNRIDEMDEWRKFGRFLKEGNENDL